LTANFERKPMLTIPYFFVKIADMSKNGRKSDFSSVEAGFVVLFS